MDPLEFKLVPLHWLTARIIRQHYILAATLTPTV
jgi:hypothetical protein